MFEDLTLTEYFVAVAALFTVTLKLKCSHVTLV
jgi:hypothetical protein